MLPPKGNYNRTSNIFEAFRRLVSYNDSFRLFFYKILVELFRLWKLILQIKAALYDSNRQKNFEAAQMNFLLLLFLEIKIFKYMYMYTPASQNKGLFLVPDFRKKGPYFGTSRNGKALFFKIFGHRLSKKGALFWVATVLIQEMTATFMPIASSSPPPTRATTLAA